jgi:hypothetical protein
MGLRAAPSQHLISLLKAILLHIMAVILLSKRRWRCFRHLGLAQGGRCGSDGADTLLQLAACACGMCTGGYGGGRLCMPTPRPRASVTVLTTVPLAASQLPTVGGPAFKFGLEWGF